MTRSQYNFVDVTPGGCQGYARDVNSSGAVLAAIRGEDSLLIGLLWHHGESLILPAHADRDISVRALNDSGLVVGSALVDDRDVACFWDQGQLTFLESPDPDSTSCADDVNDHGMIVGRRPKQKPDQFSDVAVCWVEGRGVELSPRIPEHPKPSSVAESVNNRGDVLGSVSLQGFLKRGRRYTVIRAADCCGVCPYRLNNRGEACGWVVDWDEEYAFLFTNRLTRLPTIAGSNARALGLNDTGVIVGASSFVAGNDEKHGCIWLAGKPVDLNDLVVNRGSYTIISAEAINNSGQIAAVAKLDGQHRAILLDPI